jgi:glutaredoxin
MKKITVYTTPTCQPCKAVIRKLEREGLEPLVVDLTHPEQVLTLLDVKARLGVGPVDPIRTPIVEVGGEIRMRELDPNVLAEIIAEAKEARP